MPNSNIGRSKRELTVGVLRSASRARIGLTDALARAAAEKGRRHIKVGSDIASADVAILVVSAVEGPLPDGRAELRLAREADVPLVVALINVDKIDDPELLDLVELEARELVRQCGYPSDLPVVQLSDFERLRRSTRDVASVAKLLDALEKYHPVHS